MICYPRGFQGHHTLKSLSCHYEYHSQRLRASRLCGDPSLNHLNLLWLDQETVRSGEIVLVTMSQWKSIVSTREQQNHTRTWDGHSERGNRSFPEAYFTHLTVLPKDVHAWKLSRNPRILYSIWPNWANEITIYGTSPCASHHPKFWGIKDQKKSINKDKQDTAFAHEKTHNMI